MIKETRTLKSFSGARRTPNDLREALATLIDQGLTVSVMMWGPPGVGKSAIVAQCARTYGLELIDLRLSQLAPTDLRGLPVPRDGMCSWFPPEFLPRAGKGILFLDEINMAPPAMQGIAQQLILDRKVGSYSVPEEWFVWAAGNRKEDQAAVFEMPAPLANRFVHLHVEPSFESFKTYALNKGINERVLAFLSFRPALLHVLNRHEPAWPSPRSWEMASRLLEAGLSPEHAVGVGAAEEFHAFEKVYGDLPDLEAILAGKTDVPFPEEPSVRYALTIGLTLRADSARRAVNAIEWMGVHAPAEWLQLFAGDLLGRLQHMGQRDQVVRALSKNERMKPILSQYREILLG